MIRLVSLPDPLPITVGEVKLHTRIDGTDEDSLIEGYLKSAIEQIERASGVGFIGATWEWYADAFPADEIEIGFGPLSTVTAIAYYDADGVEQTLGAETYTVDAVAEPGAIYPVSEWPATEDRANAVKVTFTAGTGAIPQPVRNAIMMTTASAYEDRLEGGELAGPAQRLVGMYRRVWF